MASCTMLAEDALDAEKKEQTWSKDCQTSSGRKITPARGCYVSAKVPRIQGLNSQATPDVILTSARSKASRAIQVFLA
jgi:hypothetical protein